MKKTVLLEGLFLALIGAIATGEGLRVTIQKDPDALYDMLGPGLYVFILGVAMITTGLGHLIVNRRASFVSEKIAVAKEMKTRMIGMTAILAGYIFVIGIVGYLVASLPFFFLEFKVAGVRSWVTNVLLTIVISLGFYLVFVQYCSVIFPRGILFQ